MYIRVCTRFRLSNFENEAFRRNLTLKRLHKIFYFKYEAIVSKFNWKQPMMQLRQQHDACHDGHGGRGVCRDDCNPRSVHHILRAVQ